MEGLKYIEPQLLALGFGLSLTTCFLIFFILWGMRKILDAVT